MLNESQESPVRSEPVEAAFEYDLSSLSSVALARLAEEVRNDEAAMSRAYDRVHNRHNR